MGTILAKENASTWEQDDVKKWKQRARDALKACYSSLNKTYWDHYQIGTDVPLLREKICCYMYGPPVVTGYNTDQIKEAEGILNTILAVHKNNRRTICEISLGIIFVACKQGENEYTLPIFKVFTGNGTPTNTPWENCCYVDTQKRVYTSWEHWQSSNSMPMLKYAYIHTHQIFDANAPLVFRSSPACDLSSCIIGTFDFVAGVTSFTCGIIGVVSMLRPSGPATLLYFAIIGGGVAAYGTGRTVFRVFDKYSHKESLSDLESFTLYLSIATTPLHLATSFANGAIVRGAVQNAKVFSPTTRTCVTVLNFSAIGVDGAMIVLGGANLIDKNKRNRLNLLDVLQFSISVFFFKNTLNQPKRATLIIKNAQESHIQAYANNLIDAETKETFNRFLIQNQGDGSIEHTSKIIRTINNVNDPNYLFDGLKDFPSVKIECQDGKTLLVSDKNNTENHIRPNTIAFSEEKSRQPVNNGQPVNSGQLENSGQPVNGQQSVNILIDDKTTEAFLKQISDKEKLFRNLKPENKKRAIKTFSGPAACNSEIAFKAVEVFKNLKRCDDVISIVEVVAAQLKKDNPETLMRDVTSVHTNKINVKELVTTLNKDIDIAKNVAKTNDMKFKNPLFAVYHYHKHGHEFPVVPNIETYLTTIPETIVQDENLMIIQNNHFESVKKTYITPQDSFAVIEEKSVETGDNTRLIKIIKTIYQKGEAYKQHLQRFPTERQWQFNVGHGIVQSFTQRVGFLGLYSIICNKSRKNICFLDTISYLVVFSFFSSGIH